MNVIVLLFVSCTVVLAQHGFIPRLASNALLANPQEFPHQVSIRINRQHMCGGAIISRNHVLTAAHCVKPFIINVAFQPAYHRERLSVVVGSNSLYEGTIHSVKRVSYHKNYVMTPTPLPPQGYDPNNYPIFNWNDIAVITLETSITLSGSVRIINLPASSSELPIGTRVDVSGFGSSVVKGPASVFLRKIKQSVVAQEECDGYYTQTFTLRIVDSHICAKGGYGQGTCSGDSGGPLIHNNAVIGIVSGGNGQCGSAKPDVYTKVSHYIPYIQYEMRYNGEVEDAFSPAVALNFENDGFVKLPIGTNLRTKLREMQTIHPEINGFPPLAIYPLMSDYPQGVYPTEAFYPVFVNPTFPLQYPEYIIIQ